MAHSSGGNLQDYIKSLYLLSYVHHVAALPASPLHCHSMTHSVHACFTFGREQETLHTLHKPRLLDHAFDEQV